MRSFFGELKQRRVYRVAIGYAIAAWASVQVASTVLPTFHVPEWVLQALIIVVGLGFPAALVLAWAFDVTPSGIRKTRRGRGLQAARHRRYAWLLGLLGLLIAAITVGAYWLSRPAIREGEIGLKLRGETAHSGTRTIPEKSIAVLPFSSLSENKENTYFANGMQQEILTRLAKIADLKVIARISTQQYQSKPGSLADVAAQLGVANLLEGSVQKSGDRIRVNVQLIQAQTDAQLWAETYDRQLTDIFEVESDIAKAIGEALHAKLTGRETRAIEDRPTEIPAAYDAYLRGLASERREELSPESLQNSSRFYREAVRLDPKFALAWARLAIGDSNLYFMNYNRTRQRREAAREASETAFRLQPESGETHLARGYYYYYGLEDYVPARRAFEEARRLLPNSPDVLLAISFIDRREAKWQDAIAHQEQAIAHDPRNTQLLFERAITAHWLGEFVDARRILDRGLNIAPDDAELVASKAATFQCEGDLAAADQQFELIALQPSDQIVFDLQMLQLLYKRDYESAIVALKEALVRPAPSLGHAISNYYVLLGLAQERAGDQPGAKATYEAGREVAQTLRRSQDDSPFLSADMAQIYAGLGDKEAAFREAQNTIEFTRKDAAIGPAAHEILARVQARFGETDAAVQTLSDVLQVPNRIFHSGMRLTPANLRLHPVWEPLRNDARFQKLCEEKS